MWFHFLQFVAMLNTIDMEVYYKSYDGHFGNSFTVQVSKHDMIHIVAS
jgi:hypothetical protein